VTRYRIMSAWLAAILSVATISIASADTLDIRNPLDTNSQITSDWDHQTGEKALDLVYDEDRSTLNAPVIWRADNGSSTLTVYYEVSEYSGGCDGVTYRVYTHTTPYDYVTIGYVFYVHLYSYSTGGSANINQNSSEYYTIGWIPSSDADCTYTGPHVHHGRVTGGSLSEASWLNSSIGSGNDYDVTSGAITIYKQ